MFAYLNGFGQSGGSLDKSVIIVNNLPFGSTVKASGYEGNAVTKFTRWCSERSFGELFRYITFLSVEAGTEAVLVATISAASKTKCYLSENSGFGDRQYFDLNPGNNYITIPVTIGADLSSPDNPAIFYKMDDSVKVCGLYIGLYTRKVTKTAIEKNNSLWVEDVDLGIWNLTARKGLLDPSILKGGTSEGITMTPVGDGSFLFQGTATDTAVNIWMAGSYMAPPSSKNTLFTIKAGMRVRIKNIILFTVIDGNPRSISKGIHKLDYDFNVTGVRAPSASKGETYNTVLYPSIEVIEGDAETSTETVTVNPFGVYNVQMKFRITPEFTYTGTCEVVDDDDNPIEDFSTWKGNWKFRFLTSGTLTITKMNSFDGYVDLFLVGGAGGGGTANTHGGSGGGRTTTVKHVLMKVGVPYQITIGAGGEVDKNGGYTTIVGDTINQKAVGGYAPDINNGGWGGSGGAAGWTGDETPGKPGVDGSDGTDGSYWKGGEGQHTTTREFGEPTGKLYSTGGESSRSGNTAAGAPNTGDGSGANKRGGSGILVLRNSRAA